MIKLHEMSYHRNSVSIFKSYDRLTINYVLTTSNNTILFIDVVNNTAILPRNGLRNP